MLAGHDEPCGRPLSRKPPLCVLLCAVLHLAAAMRARAAVQRGVGAAALTPLALISALLSLVWTASRSTVAYPVYALCTQASLVLWSLRLFASAAPSVVLASATALAAQLAAAKWRAMTFHRAKVATCGHSPRLPPLLLRLLLGNRPLPVPLNAGLSDGSSVSASAAPSGVAAGARRVRRLLVIINPTAGGGFGRHAWSAAKAVFDADGVECDVRLTERRGDATRFAATLPGDGCDGVVAVGGDGTLSEVLNGLMQRPAADRPPLGCVPGGTCNNYSRDLYCGGAPACDPATAARRILAGRVAPMDAGRVEHLNHSGESVTTWSLNSVAWGVGLVAVQWAQRLAFLGPAKFDLGGLIAILTYHPVAARVTMRSGGREFKAAGKYMIVMNQVCQRSGNGFRFGPFAKLDDGLMDTCALQSGVLRTLELFDEVKREGAHPFAADTEYWQWDYQHFDTISPTPMSVDGEDSGTTPMACSCVRGAFSCYV
eukprot:TRINITY_DN47153_c0_g1_i1.p1 TRINITY_DN47153_c0_g1~~TRINITY_DN47153_c0_g1_i1.p1  ORF type:complete len:486 (+),score=92.99 TRINITY_DN47153_c0_g1_i1:77-1534(+)